MKWDVIAKILEILSHKSKKERATLMDHTFIFVGSISIFFYILFNLHSVKIDGVLGTIITPLTPYFIGLGLILGSFPLCKFAVKKFI
jgi:alanine-alpha-ketoisovalerate/valine-pyruvate aminotransferase